MKPYGNHKDKFGLSNSNNQKKGRWSRLFLHNELRTYKKHERYLSKIEIIKLIQDYILNK